MPMRQYTNILKQESFIKTFNQQPHISPIIIFTNHRGLKIQIVRPRDRTALT